MEVFIIFIYFLWMLIVPQYITRGFRNLPNNDKPLMIFAVIFFIGLTLGFTVSLFDWGILTYN